MTKPLQSASLTGRALAGLPRKAKWLMLAGICALLAACGAPALPTPSVPLPTTVVTQPTPPATVVASATATAAPTLVPTPIPPPCGQPVLTLGAAKFRVETLARAADGSLAVPPDKPGVAYWVEGTNAHYVFALSPTAGNLALNGSLERGDAAKIAWGDCSTEDFVVTAIASGKPDLAKLFDQSAGGLSVAILPAAAEQSLLITAGRPPVQGAATPEPTEVNALNAELSFLSQQTSADGKSLVMNIALKNKDSKPLTVTAKDISLGVENAAPAAPLSVEPSLPQTIAAGASQTFLITFPKPAGNTAVFKLLSFSTDIYF
jgi:hypothetical protein